MVITLLAIIIIALLLAFANGANDNAKGVATLIGSLALKSALWLAAAATFAGSIAAIFLATSLVARFSGKGIVDPQVVATGSFALCVGLAAGITVLAATSLKAFYLLLFKNIRTIRIM